MNGYIKLHKKMLKWGWYSDIPVKVVFLHLLLTANFADGECRGYKLKPGQAVIGLQQLSRDLNLTIQQVRTALKKLESTGEITKFSTNQFTIVTIENWALYQADTSKDNKPTTNEQQTDNKPTTNEQQHYKNNKNDKNDKNNKNIFIAPTIEEVREFCRERGNNVDPERFWNYYQSNGWVVGKTKMKDWKAAVRTWERQEKSNGSNSGNTKRSGKFDHIGTWV